MRRGGLVVQRAAAVLVWVPVLMARPVLESPGGGAGALNLALLLLGAGACTIAVLDSWPAPSRRAEWAWVALALITLVGSALWAAWSPIWIVVALAAGAALTTRHTLIAVTVCAVAAAATASRLVGTNGSVLEPAFVVGLAGTTAAVLSRLIVTNEMLGRTREQLAVAAVAHERDRVARDLHDVLGHTLSLMVVKAAAVQRLVESDPGAAIRHAGDIEEVGRSALAEVRQTLSDTARPTLAGELASARETLATAGIDTRLAVAPSTGGADWAPLAWALREGVTNVVRHSQARHCWIELEHRDNGLRLTITDDGIGAVASDLSDEPVGRLGTGLGGLKRRIAQAGGQVEAHATRQGFTLTAWLPDRAGEGA